MTAFSRELACPDCNREYLLSGTLTNPSSETEALAEVRCSCGYWIAVFIPSSVPRDRLIVTLRGDEHPQGERVLEVRLPKKKKTA